MPRGRRLQGATRETMKLLLVNPNITEAMTEAMAEEARRFASPGTDIVAVTAAFGTQYVENRAEAAIAWKRVILRAIVLCSNRPDFQ